MQKPKKKNAASLKGSKPASATHRGRSARPERVADEDVPAFTSALCSLQFPVFIKDLKLRYVCVNEAFARFFGKDAAFFIGKSDEDVFPGRDIEESLHCQKEIITGGSAHSSYEHPELNASGEPRWLLTTIDPLKSPDGRLVTGILGASIDVSESKVARTELKLLSTALQQLSDIIVITDASPRICYVNPAFVDITGYSVEEAIGKNPSILKSGMQSRSFYRKMWKKISSGKSWKGYFMNKRKDGSIYREMATISPVFGDDGHILNYVAVKRDISREAELEEQLQQAHKMEAIGRLAGGIAHDFNNILTVIMGYSKILLDKLSTSDASYLKIKEINKAGQRAAELTKQMLAFSRRQVLSYSSLNINSLLLEMKGILSDIAGKGVELVFSLAPSIDIILTNRVQAEQIVINLLTNARDAVEGRGKVQIATSNTFLKEGFKNGFFDVPPGAYVELRVSDDGCGMDEETIKCIFEPFFTTKPSSCGTGLGLSTVYGIVKQHNGCISVESRLGKGSVFKVLLPSVPEGFGLPEEETDSGMKDKDSEAMILVVDDEKPILEMAESMLKFMGYSVVTAESGEQALETYKGLEGKADLLVADVMLGGMSGVALASKLRKIDPALKVLFMSGYAGEALAGIDLSNPLNKFIEKPFSMSSLKQGVRSVLRRKGAK